MKPTRFLAVALVLVGLIATVNAAGTPAGTTISNQAQGSYNDANGNEVAGATAGYVLSNTVTTTVSQVAGASLGANQAQNIAALSTVLYDVTFTNTGNGSDTFALSAGIGSGLTGTYSYEIYQDVNNDGTIDAGIDLVVTSTGSMVADGVYNLLIKVTDTTPGGAPEGEISVITLTAQSGFSAGVSDATVLTTTVQAATIAATITADNPTPIPGDVVTYSICITNNGTAIAYNVLFANLIPANSTYSPGSIRLGTTGWASGSLITDGSDSPTDEGDFNITSANTVTINLGNLAISGQVCVYYKVSIDAGVGQGTTITNTPSIDFNNVGGTPYPTVNPTGDTAISVAESFGVDIASTGTTTFTADPGGSLIYPFTVQNLGNGTDNFNLTYTSTYVVWTFYADDGDGVLSTAELAAGSITVTGNLIQNQLSSFVASGVIPTGTTDTAADATTFTATSQGASVTVSDFVTASATCTAPILTLVKSVSPTGSQPPGTTLTYTITVANSGTGAASTVVVSDAIPTNTSYVGSSMTVDASPVNDASNGDGGTYTGTSVVFEFPTLDQSGGTTPSHTLTFQVTIN